MVGIRKIGVIFGSLLLALAMLPSAFAVAGGPPATFTTINFDADGGNFCKNGQPASETVVNCNIYGGKQYVWLNGGPENAALADGMYSFAVVVPGGQHNPNQGAEKNLSDTNAAPYDAEALNADGSAIPSGDARSNRTFTVSGGTVSYFGTHTFDSNKIRLMPYDDTTNNGGVYILAICRISTQDELVDPRVCKYDAFKVQLPEAPVRVQAVLSGTKYLDANMNGVLDPGEAGLVGWTIDINDGASEVGTATTDAEGNWSFTTPEVAEGTSQTFTISEEQQSGFLQTGNTTDQSSATGNVGVALTNKIYTLTLPNTGPGSASGLNFGNIPLASGLTASKTATPRFTRTFAWDIAKNADKTTINIADGGAATFNYTVSVTHDTGTDSGWAVAGTITITNPNAGAVTVGVTDAIGNTACAVQNGGVATVAANGTSDLTYTCSLTAATSGTNTATISWLEQMTDGRLLQAGTTTATKAFAFGGPTTTVDGSVTVGDPNAPNGGSLGTVSSTDPSPTELKYSHTFSGDPAGKCTTHDNTATSTTNITQTTDTASKQVTVCVGADLTVVKTAATAFTRTYGWTIAKDADKTRLTIAEGGSATFTYTVNVSHDAGTDSLWTTSGTITVSNPNDWEDITANVTDAIDNGGACVVTGGTNLLIGKSSSSAPLAYTCTYASAPSALAGLNTATATWDKTTASTPSGSATGTATGTFGDPTIKDGSVSVSDPLDPSAPRAFLYSAATNPQSFSYSTTYSGDPAGTCKSHDNTATFTSNTTSTQDAASKTVTVCVAKDVTVAKTVVPTFTRTYGWTITKNVDKTSVRALNGTATFNYTVVASQTRATDSGWAATGSITISNPNDFEAITATVSDAAIGGTCALTEANNVVSVAASGTATLHYTCGFASGASTTNTATATWDKAAATTPTGMASDTKNVAFVTPTTRTDESITVTDTFNGTPTTLGTVNATEAAPFASATYTYSHTVNVPAHDCVSYSNIATFTTNDTLTTGSATKTVTVCRIPPQTGALTIGFWQNKNGQAIITGGSSTANICNSGTWLRQYAPFQDLSATATCAQVGAYATNVIKAASSAGDSMNPMLKAQMLATALDVYFSDPALGTNKINAASPIGARNIDLVNMCADAVSCSSYENASSAFGGAASMTVSQMLTYAASQSNAGGSMWYANVKSTQELAKDSFDAINNEKALQAP